MCKIVIADDEPLICDAICSVIRSVLPQIDIAGVFHDGDDLFTFLTKNQVDIVLTDILMPNKSGLDVVQFLLAMGHKTYTVLITAYREFDYAKRAIELQVNAFLTKPFSSQQLLSELRKAIDWVAVTRHVEPDNHAIYRNLLHFLYDNTSSDFDISSFSKVHFCNNTIPATQLKCAEFIFYTDFLSHLDQQKTDSLIHELTEVGEIDDIEQTTFFITLQKTSIVFLGFFSNVPSSSCLNTISRIIEQYTTAAPCSQVAVYSNLEEYLYYRHFKNVMGAFSKLLSTGGLHAAQTYIHTFFETCSTFQRTLFAQFLENTYTISTSDTSVSGLIHAVDLFVNQALDNSNSRYIIDAAKKYIRDNYTCCDLSLESTAEALSVSSGYLSRVFKKKTSQNFSEYLLKTRMDHAKRLLRTTNMSTSDIAYSVGYRNPTYFRTSFKTYWGITPKQYRQTHIQGETL